MGCHPQAGLSETRSNVAEKQFHPVSEKKCVCWWAEPGSGMSPKWQMSGVVQGGGDSGREQPHEPVTARTVPLFAAFSLGWVEH